LNEKADECTMERFSGGNVKDRHHLENLILTTTQYQTISSRTEIRTWTVFI